MVEFILYVADQTASRDFYRAVLGLDPVLDVPGMTEFQLTADCKLGLMPNSGIARILGDALPHPGAGVGIPRAELYLSVADAQASFERAVLVGARAVSAARRRDWSDTVSYVADPDGHIIAFAQPA